MAIPPLWKYFLQYNRIAEVFSSDEIGKVFPDVKVELLPVRANIGYSTKMYRLFLEIWTRYSRKQALLSTLSTEFSTSEGKSMYETAITLRIKSAARLLCPSLAAMYKNKQDAKNVARSFFRFRENRDFKELRNIFRYGGNNELTRKIQQFFREGHICPLKT